MPFALKTPEATSVKSFKGVLVIPDEETAQAIFSPADIKNKARKSAGKSAVQMDSIEKKEKGLELTLQLFLSPPPPMNPGNFQDLIKQSQLAMATRILVHVEDTAGGASTKQLVCEVRRPKSAPKVIPFEFGPIDWKTD